MSLFESAEQAVLNGLNFRYSKHFSAVHFSEEKSAVEVVESLPFSVLDVDFKASVLHQRMPQTRLFVSEISALDLHFLLVSFFERYWLFIYPLSADAKAVRIVPAPGYTVTECAGAPIHTDDALKPPVCVRILPETRKAERKTECALERVIETERKRHPLHFLQLSDIETVKKIDRLWADLPWIDAEGKPNAALVQNFPEASIWLNALYAHLGWKDMGIRDSVPNWKTEGFLQQYRNNAYTLSHIQEFWERIHFPVYALKLKQNIRKNPSEYIAFALLAIKERFIWQNKLCALVLDALPQPLRGLIELLFLLKQQTPLFIHGETLHLSASPSQALQQTLRQSDERLQAGQLRHHKREWTFLHVHPWFTFKIDQKAELKWKEGKKELQVLPLIWRPPLAETDWHFTELTYGTVLVRFPLAWQQFTVTLNNVRLKCLRKKKRFQLSVRLAKSDEIQLNGQTFSGRDNRYHTVYVSIPPQTDRPAPSLIWLNRFGSARRLAEGMYLRGWLKDRNHILHERLHVRKEGQRHSVQVDANESLLPAGNRVREAGTYLISARHCDTQNLELTTTDSVLTKFLYTPPEQLLGRLIVFSDSDPAHIREVFIRGLGMAPVCRPLRFVGNDLHNITCIVAESFDGHSVTKKQGMTIMRRLFGLSADVLLFHPDALPEVLQTKLFHFHPDLSG